MCNQLQYELFYVHGHSFWPVDFNNLINKIFKTILLTKNFKFKHYEKQTS